MSYKIAFAVKGDIIHIAHPGVYRKIRLLVSYSLQAVLRKSFICSGQCIFDTQIFLP